MVIEFFSDPATANGGPGDLRQEKQPKRIPQVVENMVELVGIEPTTSSLRTMRSPS